MLTWICCVLHNENLFISFLADAQVPIFFPLLELRWKCHGTQCLNCLPNGCVAWNLSPYFGIFGTHRPSKYRYCRKTMLLAYSARHIQPWLLTHTLHLNLLLQISNKLILVHSVNANVYVCVNLTKDMEYQQAEKDSGDKGKQKSNSTTEFIWIKWISATWKIKGISAMDAKGIWTGLHILSAHCNACMNF